MDNYEQRHPGLPHNVASTASSAREFQYDARKFERLWCRMIRENDGLRDVDPNARDEICNRALETIATTAGPRWYHQARIAYVLPWEFSDWVVDSDGYEDHFRLPIALPRNSRDISMASFQSPTVYLPTRQNVMRLLDAIAAVSDANNALRGCVE